MNCAGTIRFNLDPLQKYSSKEVWNALHLVGLKDHIQVRLLSQFSQPQSLEMGLDHFLSPGCTTFSAGQVSAIISVFIQKETTSLLLSRNSQPISHHYLRRSHSVY